METAAITASVFSSAQWLQSKTKRNKYWYDSPFLRTNNSSIKKQTAVSACLCKVLGARYVNLVAWVFHKHSASAATCSKPISLTLLAIRQRSKRWTLTRSIHQGWRHKREGKNPDRVLNRLSRNSFYLNDLMSWNAQISAYRCPEQKVKQTLECTFFTRMVYSTIFTKASGQNTSRSWPLFINPSYTASKCYLWPNCAGLPWVTQALVGM